MELDNFIKNLVNQYNDLNSGGITAETNFRDMEGYSSIIALSIIAMVDEEYNVRLKGDDIRNSKTINDLYEIVKSRL